MLLTAWYDVGAFSDQCNYAAAGCCCAFGAMGCLLKSIDVGLRCQYGFPPNAVARRCGALINLCAPLQYACVYLHPALLPHLLQLLVQVAAMAVGSLQVCDAAYVITAVPVNPVLLPAPAAAACIARGALLAAASAPCSSTK
jgi:hypothetical protein